MKKKSNEKINNQNKLYFKTLSSTRASLNKLDLYLSALAVGGIDLTLCTLLYKSFGGGTLFNFLIQSLVTINLIILPGVIVQFSPRLKKGAYQYQDKIGIWQVVFSVCLGINLIWLAIFLIIQKNGDFKYETMWITIISFSLIYFICIFYQQSWLKKQLLVGFSKELSERNKNSGSLVKNPASLLIIFSGSMFAARMTSGQANFLGIVSAVLFVFWFSRLTVEYAYLAKLKRVDRYFWEEYVEIKDNYGLRRLAFIRIIFEVVILFSINIIRIDIIPKHSSIIPLLQFLPKLFLFYWLIRILLWLKRKYFTSDNK